MDLLPTELWLEVFAHLPPAAHRSLSSTHRILYDIARPLGFTEFTLYTYPYESKPERAQLDDALQRLRFWTSPRIAPNVRLCFTREASHMWDWSSSLRRNDSEHVLISAFFERLPHFTGLERLYADDIQFTHTGITNLCGLPALTHLEVSGMTVLIPGHVDPALTLCVASFTIELDYQYMNDVWFSLLSRDTLRELDLLNLFTLVGIKVPPFPNVHTLTTRAIPNAAYVVEIFNNFPNLRSFSNTYGDVLQNLTPTQESSIFPVLKEYTGTCLNLHIFARRATLTHITLISGLLFAGLITELQGITPLPNITFLSVPFITSSRVAFGKTEAESLFAFFPNLTELQLTLVPTEHGGLLTRRMTSFLKMLPSNPLLPSTLHSLSLKWDFSQYDDGDPEMAYALASPLPADIPEFSVLRAELIAKCPALTYILLDRCHFLFLWWKTSFVWEATARSFDDAQAIREQLEKTPRENPVHTLFR